MARYRRYFTPEFKAETVLLRMAGTVPLAELCRQRQVTAEQIDTWQEFFVAQSPKVFGDAVAEQQAAQITRLERLVGQLTAENEVLKKTLSMRGSARLGAGR
jgi:transposase-like protein